MTLAEIRQRKAAKVAEQRAMLAKAQSESRNLNADEARAFDALKSEVTDLEQAETRQQFVDEAERRAAGVTVSHGSDDARASLEQRVSLLSVLRAATEGRALTGAEAEMHAELERRNGTAKHGGILVPLSAFETRANTVAGSPDLVGTVARPDLYIGPLRRSLLVRKLGVRTLSGLVGNVSIPKAGTGLTVGWVAEGGNVPESDMGFDAVTLSPKHVGGVTEMSRQLIQQSAPAIEDLVRDDLSFAIASAVDSAIVAGSGIGAIPKGLTVRTGANGDVQTADLPTTWADVLAIEQMLAAVNVSPTGWYTTPSVMTTLRGTLKSASAGSDYLATADKIGDLPAAASNSAGLGAMAILGDWSQILLGQWGDAVEILVNPYAEGPYRRGGVLVRAFSTVDVAVRHEEAFVIAS